MNLYSRIVHKNNEYLFTDLKKAMGLSESDISKIPYIKRFLIENHLRNAFKNSNTSADIRLSDFKRGAELRIEPHRIIMQDFSGLPVLLDLMMIKKKMDKNSGSRSGFEMKVPVDLVVDHSHDVVYWGDRDSVRNNMSSELCSNRSRLLFLKMAESIFDNVNVFYPGSGIIHQINTEQLSKLVVTENKGDSSLIYPEMVWGTDSHSTMINGAGIMGWGTGGIEALSAILGMAPCVDMPLIVGVHLKNRLKEGINHYDLALFIVNKLRNLGFQGYSAEFFGESVKDIPVQGRCTIANMAPEYGAGSGFFPPDEESLKFLELAGRVKERNFYRDYLEQAGLFQDYISEPEYDEVVEIDLAEVSVSIAGPSNPFEKREFVNSCKKIREESEDKELAIASITSCTSTANPFLIVQAGLFMRNCLNAGLRSSEKVKKTFTPGSVAVKRYLEAMDLLKYYEDSGFFITGYGCGTCLGNSGALSESGKMIENSFALISGNRNFKGRIHESISGCFLGSPWLVAAGAFKGSISYDFLNDILGYNKEGNPVKVSDMMPADEEVKAYIKNYINEETFRKNTDKKISDLVKGNLAGNFVFSDHKSYFKIPPFLDDQYMGNETCRTKRYQVLLKLRDNITTDHISPVCKIPPDSDAGRYLLSEGCRKNDLNSYGTRRGNHEVMVRGAFTNRSLSNTMDSRELGSMTVKYPQREIMTVFKASELYRKESKELVIFAGMNYGMGSARDWAAKAVKLLGVRCVIAESFERIHRRNLVHMGVWPLVITETDREKVRKLRDPEMVEFDINQFTCKDEDKYIKIISNRGYILAGVRPDLRSSAELLYLKEGGIIPYLCR